MSTGTTNYGLEKPASTDNYDIGVFNNNADKIDAQMKANAGTAAAAAAAITTHNAASNAHAALFAAKEGVLKTQDAKSAPADADKMPVVDSADSGKTKLVLWSGIRSALGTAFASVFAALSHASTHAIGGSDPLKPGDIGAADKTKMFYPNNQYGTVYVANLNLAVSGFYQCASTAAGAPNTSSDWFVLHTNSNAGTTAAWQLARAYSDGTMYIRQKTNSTWSAWAKFDAQQMDVSSSTAAKYSGCTTVDEILSKLGSFQSGLGNEYVWAKQERQDLDQKIEFTNQPFLNFSSSGDTSTCYYSDSYTINLGKYVLTNPSSVSVSYYNYTNANVLKGKWVKKSGDDWTLYKIASDATITNAYPQSNDYQVVVSSFFSISQPYSVLNTIEYVNSTDSAAYPPSVSDGYIYTPLGKLGNKVQIASCFYTGTGTYGYDNLNSITAPFEIKIAIVGYAVREVGNQIGLFVCPYNNYFTDCNYGSAKLSYKASSDGKTLYWYNNSYASSQFNYSGTIYKAIMIGW